MNEDINRKIAEWLGTHWHEYKIVGGVTTDDFRTALSQASTTFYRCEGCGDEVWPNCQKPNPDYTTDATATLTLIDRIRALGYRWAVLGDGDGPFMCRIGRHIEVLESSLPMAVAQAVIKLLETEGENEGK